MNDRLLFKVYCLACGQQYEQWSVEPPICCGACGERYYYGYDTTFDGGKNAQISH